MRLTLLTALLLSSFAALHAADAPKLLPPDMPASIRPDPKWTAQAAEDAKQDFTSIPFDGHPGEVVKLPNGHLIVSLWDKTSIVELDENLKTVWQINTVIGNYLGHGFEGKQPMVFEVTRDEKVMWEFVDHARFKTVCQMQVLDVPADATKGEVLR